MKIRTGFVSNSSSSSFCVLGVFLPVDKVQELLPAIVDNNLNAYSNSDYHNAMSGLWLDKESIVAQEVKSMDQYCGNDPKILVGFDVDGKSYTDLQSKAEVLKKVLLVTDGYLTLNGWGFYDG